MDADTCIAIAKRVLHPDRLGLERARKAVAGLSDPTEAWHALGASGLVPPAFSSDPTRSFWPFGPAASLDFRASRVWYSPIVTRASDASEPMGRVDREWVSLTRPPSVRAAITVASDIEGMVRAETLAREAVARGRPWQSPNVDHVVWYLEVDRVPSIDPLHDSPDVRGAFWKEGVGAIATTPDPCRPRRAGYGGIDFQSVDEELAYMLGRDLVLWHGWQKRVQSGASIPVNGVSGRRAPASLVGRSYADVPDPIAPFVELWNTGYILLDVNEEVIVLRAPLVEL